MDISTGIGLTLIALLLSFWALTWARRAANAAERTAIAAEKSALAAERSALAAKRGAEAAETSALAAREAAGIKSERTLDEAAQSRADRVDAVVKEVTDSWPKEGSAWPVIERNTGLSDQEVDEIIQKAFFAMGRTESEARQHAVAVLNMRRDPKG